MTICHYNPPFTNSIYEPAKCAFWEGSITQRRTISHSGLGIVAKVKLNQSHASAWCAIATLMMWEYALFVKGTSAWIISMVMFLILLEFSIKVDIHTYWIWYRWKGFFQHITFFNMSLLKNKRVRINKQIYLRLIHYIGKVSVTSKYKR